MPEFEVVGAVMVPEFEVVGAGMLPEFEVVGAGMLPEFEVGSVTVPEFAGKSGAGMLPEFEVGSVTVPEFEVVGAVTGGAVVGAIFGRDPGGAARYAPP